MATTQQHRKDQPGSDGKKGLVIQGQGLAKNLFGEEQPAAHGQRQQQETQHQHAEEQGLHRHEGRQATQAAPHYPAVQHFFRETHENGVQRRQGEQAVGEHGGKEMELETDRLRMRHQMPLPEQRWQHGTDRRQRQHHGLHAFHARHEAFQPVNQHRQPHHQRQGERKGKIHAARPEQAGEYGVGMDDDRAANDSPLPDMHRAGDTLLLPIAPAAVPEMEAEDGVKQGSKDMRGKLNYNIDHSAILLEAHLTCSTT